MTSLMQISLALVLFLAGISTVNAQTSSPDKSSGGDSAGKTIPKDPVIVVGPSPWKNETTVSSPTVEKVADGIQSLYASFTVPGRRIVKPEQVSLIFITSSARYENDHVVSISLDGMDYGPWFSEFAFNPYKSEGNVEGRVTAPIPYYVYLEMLEAKKVEIRVGTTRFELNGKDQGALRRLKKTVDEEADK
jgi:hypothetical protein